MSKQFVVAIFSILILAPAATGATTAGDSRRADVSDGDIESTVAVSSTTEPVFSGPAGSDLLDNLQSFLRQRKVDVDQLTVDQMVGVMIDWYRSVPVDAHGDGATDMLLFRYGGWSEGCATGFNVSLMRRAGAASVAGITLMFEPSGGAELAAFSTAMSDAASINGFVQTIRHSPAFQKFGAAQTMGVLLEKGGLR